jgi:hypothetical protein
MKLINPFPVPNSIFSITLFLIFFGCIGINGPDVIRGDKMVGKIRKALQERVAACNFSERLDLTVPNLGFTLNYNQRVFYRVSDMDDCLSIIQSFPCAGFESPVLGELTQGDLLVPAFCNDIPPNAWYESPYSQGNFF